jgi:ATPase subunit of ABC transporter with duplicated ATPase domains
MAEEVILRFDEVTFEFVHKKPLLDEASFCVHKGAKITLMGQNGAGKSTLFKLIRSELQPTKGLISINRDLSIATALQSVPREDLELSVADYFAKAFSEPQPNLLSQVSKVLRAVNLEVPAERKVGELSGGQQARLLLAFALIQNPDILLLDEPTNNLDEKGIDHLINFLIGYEKTVIVISHDAGFLNCFTEGVLYLDSFTKKIENYVGDYYTVVEEINARIEKEQKKNAQLEKQIQDRKEKVNFFAHKGGKMRKLAHKLKEETEELEENMVEVRKEDKTIRPFSIPAQEDISGDIVTISAVSIMRDGVPEIRPVEKVLHKRSRLLVTGPNGMGKSTFLRALVGGEGEGAKILPEVKVGYYSQDFSTLDFEQTVFDCLKEAMGQSNDEQYMRSVAAGFLITGNLMPHKISFLSDGQKGLLTFARLVLMRPGLLVMDEPTNHINFRHIPVIAEALNEYEGTLILVSHMQEFVDEIRFDETMELENI